jgi:membrane fusion protein, heavy metal efflux system
MVIASKNAAQRICRRRSLDTVVCLLTAAVALAGFPAVAAAADALIEMKPEQQAAYGIEVAALQPAEAILGEKLPAQVVVPNDRLQVISAPLGGLVEMLRVAVGDEVRQGQPLARLRSPDLLALERDYLQALTQLNLAQANLDRDRQLFADGIIAQRRYLEAQSHYAELSAQVQQLREMLKLAGLGAAEMEALQRSRALTSELTVVSPLDGIVLEQMAVAGQRVEAVSPLYRIGSLAPLWLEIHVPIDRLAGLRLGMRVEVPAAGVAGRLITIGRGVHEVDQGVLLRAELTEGAERLLPGQFVQVQLAREPASGQRYRVPRQAVVRSQQGSYVFVQQPGGFRAQAVEVLSEQPQEAVIAGDLKPDDKVAVSGTAAIKGAWTGLGGGE